MAMIRTTVGVVVTCLVVLGLPMGPRPSIGADGPPRPVEALREAIVPAREIPGPARRDALLSDLADALAILGAIPDAITVKGAIEDRMTRAGVVRSLVQSQCDRGDVAGAVQSAAELDTPEAEQAGYHSTAYAQIAVALARSGDWDGAVRRARRCDPWTLARTIAEVIGMRAEKGDVDGAIRQAERLENIGDPRHRDNDSLPAPRKLAVVKLAGVLAARNESDRADRLLAAHPDAMIDGLAAIARARLKARDMDGAAAAARRLLDRGGDPQAEAIARVVLIRTLIAGGKLDDAARMSEGPWKKPVVTQRNRFMPPSIEPIRSQALVAIARARIDRGDVDAGVATLASMPSGLTRSFDLLKLARERLEKGDRSTAEKLATAARAAMDEPGGSEFYLADVGAVMARCGLVEPSRRLFERALFARDIGSAINRSYVAITQAQEGGDVEGATRTIAAIPEAEARDHARLRLAVHHAREGRTQAALDVAAAIGDAAVRATATAQAGMIAARRGDRDRALGAAACRRAVEMVATPNAEVARILGHAWAAVPGEAVAAIEWARRRPTSELRAAALIGAGWGLSGRPFWISGPSRYVIHETTGGGQQPQPPTYDDLDD